MKPPIYKIQNPIVDIQLELDQIDGFQNQISYFKKWLEKFIKYNLAIQFSVLQKEDLDIPPNLRVLIVQFFQTPPSLGLCLNIIRHIIPLINTSKKIDNQFIYYFKIVKKNIYLLEELVQIRNIEAHGLRPLNAKDWQKINTNISKLIEIPIFYSTQLCYSQNENLSTHKLTDENIYSVCMKLEDVSNIEPDSILNTYNSLFPIMLCDSDGNLFYWNKKNGNNGIYTMYSDTSEIIEIKEITRLIGFPYDDWRNSNNPDFINYLKYRSNATDLLFQDTSIDINHWYSELLVARRLEVELNLDKNERISHVWEAEAIMEKLLPVTDEELIKKYRLIIFERHKQFDELDFEQQQLLIQYIMDSGIVLIEYYSIIKKHHLGIPITCNMIKLLPRMRYLGWRTDNTILKLWEIYIKIQKYREIFEYKIPAILSVITTAILMTLKIENPLAIFLFFPILLTFRLIQGLIRGVDFKTLNYNLNRIENNQDVKIYNIKFVLAFLKAVYGKHMLIRFSSLQDSSTINSSTVRDLPFIDTSKADWQAFFNNGVSFVALKRKKIVNYNDLISLFPDNVKGTHVIFAVKEYFNYCFNIGKPEMIVQFGWSFTKVNSDLCNVRGAWFDDDDFINEYEKEFYTSCINELIWNYNTAILLNTLKTGAETMADFNNTLYLNSADREIDWQQLSPQDLVRHYYLFGFICSVLKNYSAAIEYFQNVYYQSTNENKLYAKYNIMFLHAAKGDVAKYITCCLDLDAEIKFSNRKIVEQIPSWLIKEVKSLSEEFQSQLKNNPNLLSQTLVWTENKSFTLGFAPMALADEAKNIKVSFVASDS